MNLGTLLDVVTSSATRKAQVSALVTAVGAGLTAVLPSSDGTAATIITIVLAVLAAFGITYATPNRPTE